jgi:hypothetical protein
MRMKPLICTIFTILGLVFCGSFLAHADTDKSATPSEVEFTSVSWKPLGYPELFYRNGDDYIKVEVPTRKRSEAYSLQAHQAFELYTAQTNSTGDSGYTLVGQGVPQSGVERMLFIVEKNASEESLPLLVRGFDDSLDTCPIGAFCFANFTEEALEVHFGETVNTLHSDAISVIKDAVAPAGGFIPFFLKDEHGNTVFESRLFGQPTGRKTVFIYPPKANRRKFSVQFLSEISSH